RRVFVTPATRHPTEQWCREQAAAFCRHAQCHSLLVEMVYHDRDAKYGKAFDRELARHGVKGLRIMPQAPNLQAFILRWIQSIELECLDSFVVLGEKHLNYFVAEYVHYYLNHRPHQGVGNMPLVESPAPPDEVPRKSQVHC